MSLKLYYDLLSQPSRTLYMFFKCAKIPFEPVQIALRRGEQFSDEFVKINRFCKIPAISHNGFNLIESIAILRYTAREFKIDDHWYPKDSKKQARVDEYLEWQHNNTRIQCGLYFMEKWLLPVRTGEPPKEKRLESLFANMENCLDQIEEEWMQNSPFITGDKITVADLVAASEIEQTRVCEYDPTKGRPHLKAWMDRVKIETNPHYDEAHAIIYRVIEVNKTKAPWMLKR